MSEEVIDRLVRVTGEVQLQCAEPIERGYQVTKAGRPGRDYAGSHQHEFIEPCLYGQQARDIVRKENDMGFVRREISASTLPRCGG